MRFANSADWKSNLGKHYQPPSSSANAPEIVALADLGSQSAAPSNPEADDGNGNSRGWASYWDSFLGDMTKDEEKKKEDKVTVEPVKKKTVDEQIKEDVLKRNRLEGSYEDNVDALAQRMKYNPAATDLDYKQAFGKCDAFGCYWPDETDSGDYYSVGKGGGTAHAKRGQAAARAKALGGRAKRRGGKGNDGGVRSDIQLKENITYIDKSPGGHSIYEWNYKGEPESNRYQGVMAQELLETAPHAVVTMDDGYLGVKYDEIDVEFTTA